MTDTLTHSDPALLPSWSLDGGGALILLLSIASSGLAYGVLPGSIRIRWTVGGPHYGPEFAPTWLVLIVFPLVVAALYVGGRWLGSRLDELEQAEPGRSLYDAAILLVLLTLLCTQLAVVIANAGVL